MHPYHWLALLMLVLLAAGCGGGGGEDREDAWREDPIPCASVEQCPVPRSTACDNSHCMDEAGEPVPLSEAERCPWSVEDMLAAVGVSAPDRLNCGEATPFRSGEVQSAEKCFEDKRGQGNNVQVSISRGVDSLHQETLVELADGRIYSMLRTASTWGMGSRSATVSSCVSTSSTHDNGPTCEGGKELLDCIETEELPLLDTPRPPPVEPRVVQHLDETGIPPVTIYLTVENAVPDAPPVGIEVGLRDAGLAYHLIVTGTFSAGQGPSDVLEVQVIPAAYMIEAGAFDQPYSYAPGERFQQLNAPTDRWVHLQYLYDADEPDSSTFAWTVSSAGPTDG